MLNRHLIPHWPIVIYKNMNPVFEPGLTILFPQTWISKRGTKIKTNATPEFLYKNLNKVQLPHQSSKRTHYLSFVLFAYFIYSLSVLLSPINNCDCNSTWHSFCWYLNIKSTTWRRKKWEANNQKNKERKTLTIRMAILCPSNESPFVMMHANEFEYFDDDRVATLRYRQKRQINECINKIIKTTTTRSNTKQKRI